MIVRISFTKFNKMFWIHLVIEIIEAIFFPAKLHAPGPRSPFEDQEPESSNQNKSASRKGTTVSSPNQITAPTEITISEAALDAALPVIGIATSTAIHTARDGIARGKSTSTIIRQTAADTATAATTSALFCVPAAIFGGPIGLIVASVYCSVGLSALRNQKRKA